NNSSCLSSRNAATRNSKEANWAVLRSIATTWLGALLNSASVLSPAEAIERHLEPGWMSRASSRMSASSQHWEYRSAEPEPRDTGFLCICGLVSQPTHDACSAVDFNNIAIAKPLSNAGNRY